MKYDSDIAEAIHENALAEFRLGILSDAEMREYDKLCLTEKAFKEKYSKGNNTRKAVKTKHAELVTA